MNRIIQWLLLAFIWPALSFAQTISLIDQQHHTPIANASYKYGNIHGTSDSDGKITVDIDDQSTLYLSHVNYGQLVITSDQLISILKDGKIIWKKQIFELQPISVIALHHSMDDSLIIVCDDQNRLAHDVSSVLAQLPEIALIKKSGSYGFDPVLRGFKYDQLNIVLDGAQSANAACPNRMDPPSSQIPVNMLSQINILKGPYSLRYGTGIGGTINFKTEPSQFDSTQLISGRISGGYETNGNISRSEGLVKISQKSFDLKFYGSVSNGNNYKDGDNNEVPSSFYRNNFGTIAGFKLSDNQSLKLSVSHNYAKDVDFPALAMDLRKDDTWLGSLNHTIKFRKKLVEWNTNIYSTYVNHLMDNYDKVITPRMADAVTDAKTYNFGGRTEGKWQLGVNQLYVGADYRGDKAEGQRSRTFLMGPNTGNTIYDNVWQDASIDQTGIFAEFRHNLSNWQLVYAGRLSLNQAKSGNPDAYFETLYEDIESSDLNKSLSIGLSKQLLSKVKAELWLGRAERSGSLTERYINFLPVGVDPYEMLGNPLLSSEKNNQMDVILNYHSKATRFQVSGFVSLVNDFISSEIRADLNPKMATAPGVRQYINIDAALLKGFELIWTQKIASNINHRLSMAYTHGTNNDTDEALPEIPPMDFRYSLQGLFLNKKLQPEIQFRHVWNQSRIATSYGETETPAFKLVNLSIDYTINNHFEVNASVNNLLDETYYEHLTRSVSTGTSAINAPGRNMIFTLVARW
ncbi:TonB-dependent receptor domain-containing protein [Carboxylicivirga caseinilyticus]|uniref:TonB-dependent receptor domain-containing protein n=1 Tax=Carboxylicivirga caseinilyticus TaxID=3417572 RepID=UPI003D3284CE|nr:TonB-dependent receptor [Marinilabiliaceae bacterium A049]